MTLKEVLPLPLVVDQLAVLQLTSEAHGLSSGLLLDGEFHNHVCSSVIFQGKSQFNINYL